MSTTTIRGDLRRAVQSTTNVPDDAARLILDRIDKAASIDDLWLAHNLICTLSVACTEDRDFHGALALLHAAQRYADVMLATGPSA